MGGSKSSSTTTVKRLPDYCEPYVKSYLTRAETLSNEAFDPYWDDPGADPTYADQDAYETAGITALAARGRAGNTTITKGITLVSAILNGDYLLGTDAFFQDVLSDAHDALANAVTTDILPIIGKTTFLVGDLSGETLADTICAGTTAKYSARMQAFLYGKNYVTGRMDQHQGLQFGVEYASQPFKDAEVLRRAGLYQREYDQGALEDEYKKWTEEEMAQVARLNILGNAIRALVGSQVTKTSPLYKPSPVISMVGGAMVGAAAGGAVGGMIAGAEIGSVIPVYGTIIGAVVGLAAGYFASQG